MRYTEVKDGRAEEHYLCADCASEKGLAGKLGAAISSLSYLLDDMVKEMAAAGQGDPEAACPACHLKLSQFRQTGRLGCGQCYQAFAPLLRRMIRQVQGSGRHLGKPKSGTARTTVSGPGGLLAKIREELAEAVRREEFEQAASLRDRIRKLEAGDGGPAA